MNQKKGFAAMAGCGLGHSPKCMNQSSLPTAVGSPASQLACHAAQHSGTPILGLNLSLPSLHQSHKKATLIVNSTSVQAQLFTSLPSMQQWHVLALSLCYATGGFLQCLQIRAGSGSLLWQEDWEGYTVGARC